MVEKVKPKKRIITGFRVILLIVLVISYNFFTSESETMSRQLEKEIPVGTSLDSAKSIMASKGFVCVRTSDKAFDAPSIEYLFCKKQEKLNDIPQYKRWEVSINYKENAVSGIMVNINKVHPCVKEGILCILYIFTGGAR